MRSISFSYFLQFHWKLFLFPFFIIFRHQKWRSKPIFRSEKQRSNIRNRSNTVFWLEKKISIRLARIIPRIKSGATSGKAFASTELDKNRRLKLEESSIRRISPFLLLAGDFDIA